MKIMYLVTEMFLGKFNQKCQSNSFCRYWNYNENIKNLKPNLTSPELYFKFVQKWLSVQGLFFKLNML